MTIFLWTAIYFIIGGLVAASEAARTGYRSRSTASFAMEYGIVILVWPVLTIGGMIWGIIQGMRS